MGAYRNLYDRMFEFFTTADGRTPFPSSYDLNFTATELSRDVTVPNDKGPFILTGIYSNDVAANISLKVANRDVTGGFIDPGALVSFAPAAGGDLVAQRKDWPAPVVALSGSTMTFQIAAAPAAGQRYVIEGMFLPPDVVVPPNFCEMQLFQVVFPTGGTVNILRPRQLTYDGVLYDFARTPGTTIAVTDQTLLSLRNEPIFRSPFFGDAVPTLGYPGSKLLLPFKRNDQLVMQMIPAAALAADVIFVFRAMKPWSI